jgi:hypothetical protein
VIVKITIAADETLLADIVEDRVLPLLREGAKKGWEKDGDNWYAFHTVKDDNQ